MQALIYEMTGIDNLVIKQLPIMDCVDHPVHTPDTYDYYGAHLDEK